MQSFPMQAFVGSPYHVVFAEPEKQPFLGVKGGSGGGGGGERHPLGYQNSKTDAKAWFFWFATRILSLLGIICIVFSIVWTSMVFFNDSDYRPVYATSTYLLNNDLKNPESWQIIPQSTWSDLSKPNPTTDAQYNHYFECWHAAGVGWAQCNNASVSDYKTCIRGKYSTLLDTCATTTSTWEISPSLNGYVNCVAAGIPLSRTSYNGLEVCLRTNTWPLYEAPQDVDSWYFLGFYNWMLVLIVGFGLFSCFVLYTGGFVIMAEDLDYDARGLRNGPLSYGVTGVCGLFSLLFLIYFLAQAYRVDGTLEPTGTYRLPGSIATNTVLLPATLIVFAYFTIEMLELWFGPSIGWFKGVLDYASRTLNGPRSQEEMLMMQQGQGGVMVGRANFPHTKPTMMTPKTIADYYFPAVTLAWADAYVLDALMVVGTVGATMQVSTATVYQLFLIVFAYRWAHTALARFIYEGYISNPDEKVYYNEKRDARGSVYYEGVHKDDREAPESTRKHLYTVRMQAMFMHLAALSCLVTMWYIFSNVNTLLSEFTLVTVMFYLWFAIPEILRFLAHVVVAFQATEQNDKNILVTSNYLIFIWDVVVRLVWIMIIYWGSSQIHGTQTFLRDRLLNVTDTITFMTA